jgi:drug/metabolite transporter (DMT)-like permease
MVDFYEEFEKRLPLFYVFLSGIGFSIQSLIIKWLVEDGYSASLHCVLVRGLIQMIQSLILIAYKVDVIDGKAPKLFGNTNFVRTMLFFRSLVGFGSIASDFIAVQYIPIGDSIVLVMLSPMIASILGYLVLGEQWRIPELVATVMSLTGAVCVAHPPFLFGYSAEELNSPARYYTGVFLALFASMNAGSAYIFVRILGTIAKMPWPYVTFSQSLAQIFLSVPFMYILNIPLMQNFSWKALFLLFVGGFVGTWSQAAMTIGMQREKSASATAMRMSDVVFGFLWQALFTKDPILPLTLFGALLVTGSILIIVFFKPPPTGVLVGPPTTVVCKDELQAEDNQLEMITEPSVVSSSDGKLLKHTSVSRDNNNSFTYAKVAQKDDLEF